MAKKAGRSGCAVETTMSVIGGRWKSVVLFRLLDGKKRFSELRRMMPNVSQRMLTVQLRELEEADLLKRTVHAEVPPRVDYELTALGKSLEPTLHAMCEWGKKLEKRLER